MILMTTGQQLAAQETRLRLDDLEARRVIQRERRRNLLMIFLLGLAIGVFLGYAWRMQQTKHEVTLSSSQWTNNIAQETFEPYEYLGTFKAPHLQ